MDNVKCWHGCRAAGNLIHCWWECKMVQPLWRAVQRFPIKLNMYLADDLAIPLLGMYPKEIKIQVHTKSCTQMFIAALFIRTPNWQQPKRSQQVLKIKLWNIHAMEFHSPTQRTKLLTYATTWIQLIDSRKPVSKGYLLYDFICMIFSKRQNYCTRMNDPRRVRSEGV